MRRNELKISEKNEIVHIFLKQKTFHFIYDLRNKMANMIVRLQVTVELL